MRSAQFVVALRYLVVVSLVVVMAAMSSGTLWPGTWDHLVGADSALARALPAPDPSARSIGDLADNGPVCAPRPGPRVQTFQDAGGGLQVSISAGTDPQGFPSRLREIRVGPMQNAAVDGGTFTARTTPFVVPISGGTQGSLRVTRLSAGQPSHVTLIILDDCGEWRTFVGGGTGVAVAPASATATPVSVIPGQPSGSIPISVTVSGSSTQYPPGSRPRVQIGTRPYATCNLSLSWPDGRMEAQPAQPASAQGFCEYRPTVPAGMRSGTATAMGTVQDLYGFNLQHVPFPIGGDLGTIPPGDNILGAADDYDFWIDDTSVEGEEVDNREGDNADNLD